MPIRNRLANLLKNVVQSYELPNKFDKDNLGADVGIPVDNDLVSVGFVFDESEKSYEFGSVLGQIESHNVKELAENLLRSEAIPGISERITNDNKLIVKGGRNGLDAQMDKDVEHGFMDDLARVAEAYDLLKQLMDQED